MKSSADIVTQLPRVLTLELTSINQYFLHARIFKNWGLAALDAKCYKKSINAMKQADKIIERILFLEGLPNLQQSGRLRIGEHTKEMFGCDLSFQLDQTKVMAEAIVICEKASDYVTRDLLTEILEYEEDH